MARPKVPPLADPSALEDARLVARHLRIGWWSLAGFAVMGLVLETLHGFKVGAYLDVSSAPRRLTWTLAHAHGSLLGLMHVALAATLALRPGINPTSARRASSALTWATVLLPGGFFLSGVQFYGGDPGPGIALVPVGAALVIYGAAVVARTLGR